MLELNRSTKIRETRTNTFLLILQAALNAQTAPPQFKEAFIIKTIKAGSINHRTH